MGILNLDLLAPSSGPVGGAPSLYKSELVTDILEVSSVSAALFTLKGSPVTLLNGTYSINHDLVENNGDGTYSIL